MIILAEDDADQRAALKLALEAAGYVLREAANGREALALEREHPCRVLITDIFMPEVDGLELIATVHAEFPQTRIIVLSGGGRRATGDYLASATLLGVDAALQKPVEIKALLETLRTLGQ